MTGLTESNSLHDALFAPRGIALIGASDDPSKTAARPLQFLRRAGYEGAVYPVNPKRGTVLGERAWPSLEALPGPVDHAYILSGTEGAIAAVENCAKVGVKVASILATGFSEAGEAGQAHAAYIRDLAREAGMRLLGPSSLGFVDTRQGLLLTANAAFAEANVPVGDIFVASHSGSIIGALLSRGKARGVGFAGFVSVGNEVDLSLGEICAAALEDDSIRGYMLFLESIRHAEALRAFALEAYRRGKPVLAYKLGRSDQAAELAYSHTGALAGEDAVADALLRECGIARVETLDGLIEAMPLLSRVLPSRGRKPNVGVVTTTGGGAAMVVDQLGLRGIPVGRPSSAIFDALSAAGVVVEPGRIVDLTMAGTQPETMTAALEILLAANEFDLIVPVVGSSARTRPELAVEPIVNVASDRAPLAVFIVPDAPGALALLGDAGVPAFRSPESCADAIAAALGRGQPRPSVGRIPDEGDRRALNEHSAYGILDTLGIDRAPTVVLPAGEPVPELPFDWPVVAKILSAEVPHKTDLGGIALNLADASQLGEAAATIRARIGSKIPAAADAPVLIQPMVRGLGEALVGYRIDPEVGPIVMVAAGGIFTEIYRDRAIRLAPVTLETAHEMIAEVKAFAAFEGFRGREKGDLEGLARAIVALSSLATQPELGVVEAEINPLLILQAGQGVVAVDALIQVTGADA
ncbi:acetate--CoA ligase family protein [Microvirga pakistanensis]|uniref:acetate--CoA ligase family protein n=1 Tax=Microvirga pakistanensis TaxID=1682650 RepID=UPI00106A373F|nr:acetate--CoA ligase [Microvirga pakistanensis]